ncbi:ISXO2-like transposase domain-containing protein [Thiocapsa roseopersicina]|uniref:ISXO2-like transposase domain-containing protein n=1 Tax=Thiocapsa roseopersicina TaxID=1058 RepID=A0A1H3DK34_THIRO|nr:IS1595 family transposase [Thiocapsa roseopersicina]CRI66049.1 hypothetical protein THIOKS1260005 [Thiocapsa sp. KS1]SDX66009.1 ISXO2-like transposase domain-containing protein [Thiocapsa roseopersicina]
MPQNPIQFQPGMSLDDLFARYGTEAQCAAALEASRWPLRFVCPHCGATAHSLFQADGREYWQCAQCRVQTSLTCGTLFENSKLALAKWFQAMYLVPQNKNNLSALSLKRHLGVCYRTAWRLKHKLLEAMAERESGRLLTGVVVADDAVVGGKRRGGKRGRGAEGKAVFIAAVEVDDDGHPQHVRFDPLPDLKGDTLRAWVRKALDPDTHLVTDAFASLVAPGRTSPPTGRSWSARANPARSLRSVGSIPSSPTSRPRSGAPITMSMSTSTWRATSPRRSIASIAASICHRWSGDSSMPASEPRPAPRNGCARAPSARREMISLRNDANHLSKNRGNNIILLKTSINVSP